jgi:hypothetical protein
MTRINRRWLAALVVALMAVPVRAFAQADEIQVYDGSLAEKGTFNLTLHTNFTPSGVKTPAFPGAVAADQSLNGVPELAYGVNQWFEAGLYLPLYSRDQNLGWGLDGFKLRALFAVPHADDRRFFYGANVELSYNATRWDTTRITSEVRTIIGWHVKPVDIILNPILDTAFDGVENLVFVPSVRVAYNVSPVWAVAVEEFADYGRVGGFNAGHDQSHQVYGVVDYGGQALNVEAGIGVGLTGASDRLTFKLIVSRGFNVKK